MATRTSFGRELYLDLAYLYFLEKSGYWGALGVVDACLEAFSWQDCFYYDRDMASDFLLPILCSGSPVMASDLKYYCEARWIDQGKPEYGLSGHQYTYVLKDLVRRWKGLFVREGLTGNKVGYRLQPNLIGGSLLL